MNRSYEPLLHGHPDLDETLPFDRKGRGLGLVDRFLYNARFLRQQRYDLVVDLQGLRTARSANGRDDL